MRKTANGSSRLLLLVLAILLLAGCNPPAPSDAKPVQPFYFYYRRVKTGFENDSGLISPELRDLGTVRYTEQELFELYCEGPKDEALTSPIPKGTELQSVERDGELILFILRQARDPMTGINASIADACLAKTAFQLEGVRRVSIRVEGRDGTLLRERELKENDLLLYDSGEFSQTLDLILYFADGDGRFLLSEKRTVSPIPAEQLPQYVVEQLILGPQTPGLYPTLPEGSSLLDINVEGGVCAVDFNSDFYLNRPTGERAEQLTLLSIVNTLCELDGINQVQFYVEGHRLDLYNAMDLSLPYTSDSAAVGPVREDMNEFSATLCLPAAEKSPLHRLPVRIRIRGTLPREEALLQTLFQRPGQNGLRNPVEKAAAPLSVSLEEGVCTVDFADSAFLGEGEEARSCAMRVIAATLCSLPEIHSVRITVKGEALTEWPLVSNDSWFLPKKTT